MSSCEQSGKASSSAVVGTAENKGTGLTTRLCEVNMGSTVRPQVPLCCGMANHTHNRQAAAALPQRLDFCYSFHYTYIVWYEVEDFFTKFRPHVKQPQ